MLKPMVGEVRHDFLEMMLVVIHIGIYGFEATAQRLGQRDPLVNGDKATNRSVKIGTDNFGPTCLFFVDGDVTAELKMGKIGFHVPSSTGRDNIFLTSSTVSKVVGSGKYTKNIAKEGQNKPFHGTWPGFRWDGMDHGNGWDNIHCCARLSRI
jgi:hypothetical protein